MGYSGATVQERVVREIRTLRARWRGLETESRITLAGHEGGNPGYRQGRSYGPPRQVPTLPAIAPHLTLGAAALACSPEADEGQTSQDQQPECRGFRNLPADTKPTDIGLCARTAEPAISGTCE